MEQSAKAEPLNDDSVPELSEPKSGDAQQASLYAQIDELETELRLTKNSPSWKITWPLRNKKAILGYLISFIAFSAKRLLVVSKDGNSHTLGASSGLLPNSWIRIRSLDSTLSGSLYIDSGDGFLEIDSLSLEFSPNNSFVLKLPTWVRGLRFDSSQQIEPGEQLFEVKQLSSFRVYPRALWQNGLFASLKTYSKGGFQALKQALFQKIDSAIKLSRWDQRRIYKSWIENREEKAQLPALPPTQPLISIAMPVFNTAPHLLKEAVESVLAQSYPNWELCIVDDGSSRQSTRELLKIFCDADQRIKILSSPTNLGISRASNKALEMASGEFVGLLDHDDVLSKDALFWIVCALGESPEAQVLFSDEDRLSLEGERLDPYFKPGWNRSMLWQHNLISHFGVYKRSLLNKIEGFRVGYEGSQDWDLALRAVEQLTDAEVVHVPKVLYHWRVEPRSVSTASSTQGSAFQAAQRAVADSFGRLKIKGDVAMGGGRLSILCKPIAGSVGVVYLEDHQLLTSSVVWQEHVEDLSTEFVCFLHSQSQELPDNLIESLKSVFQLPAVAAAGGLLLDSKGCVLDGLYKYENSQFWSLRFPYEALKTQRTLVSARNVNLLSPYCLIVRRNTIKEAMNLVDAPINISLALCAKRNGLSSMLFPQLHYQTRGDRKLPLAFQVGTELKEYRNNNLSTDDPYLGLNF